MELDFESALKDLQMDLGQLNPNYQPEPEAPRAQLRNFDPNWRDNLVQGIQDATGNTTDATQNRLLDLVFGSHGLGSNQGGVGLIDIAGAPAFADAGEAAYEGDYAGAVQGVGLAALPFGLGRLLKPAAKAVEGGDDVANQISALAERAQELGIKRLPPAPPGTPKEKVLQDMTAFIEAAEARIPAGSSTAVPSGIGAKALEDRRVINRYLSENPYVQSVPGRQGFPTKAEQHQLADEFIKGGGQLPPPGPWGRNTYGDVRDAFAAQVAKDAEAAQQAVRPALRREDIPSLNRAGPEPRAPRQHLEQAPAVQQSDNELQALTRAYQSKEAEVQELRSELSRLKKENPMLNLGVVSEYRQRPKAYEKKRVNKLENILDRINKAN